MPLCPLYSILPRKTDEIMWIRLAKHGIRICGQCRHIFYSWRSDCSDCMRSIHRKTKFARGTSAGVKFEEGTCKILSSEQTPFWEDLPTCSCGKNCNEEYPCVTVKAEFAQHDTVNFTGTIHENYYALSADCLYIPDCSNDFDENANSVYQHFQKIIVPLVNYDSRYPYLQGYNSTKIVYNTNFTFHCWGYDGDIYIDHSYSMEKVYLSLLIPSGAILIGLFITGTMGSDEHRSCVGDMLFLPLYFIGGIIMAIGECFDCGRPKCNCFKRSSSERTRRRSIEPPSIDIATLDYEGDQSFAERRRRSLSAGTFASINLSTLDLRPRISNVDEPRRVSVLQPTNDSSVDPSFPSSVAPPSYNNIHNTYNGYESSFYPSSAIVTGPTDSSLYSSDAMPPPPSYDDVVDS